MNGVPLSQHDNLSLRENEVREPLVHSFRSSRMLTMRRMKRHWALYVMVSPAVALLIVFAVYPLLLGAIISLQNFHVIGIRPFVGLQNYLQVLQDPYFWQVFQNTLLLGGGTLVFGFVSALIVALSLNEVIHTPVKRATQMIIYLPHLFSWVIVGGIWIYILAPDVGLVNQVLKLFGEQPIQFMTQGGTARWVMILSAVWKDVGFNCIVFLASIVGISPALYESARIDGAGRFQQAWNITLPQLVPTMKVVLMLMVMGVLRIFDQIYVMRNGLNQRGVDVVMTYVFDKGITQFQMGFASAASIVVLIMTLVLATVVRKLIRYDEV